MVLSWQIRDVTCRMGSHSDTCYPSNPTQVNAPRPNPSPQANARFTYHWGMEGWVDLGYPAMERPGVELATSRSQVRRPNHYTTEPPDPTESRADQSVSFPVRSCLALLFHKPDSLHPILVYSLPVHLMQTDTHYEEFKRLLTIFSFGVMSRHSCD